MKTAYLFGAACALGCLCSPLLAQLSADVAPFDTLATSSEAEAEPSLKLSGYVDAYYQHVLTSASGTEDALAFPTSFAQETRGFGVGNANLLLEKDFKQVAFVGQVGFGPRANAANGAFPNLQQLYVAYSPSDAVTFTLGQFGTFVGYEVIDATANMNYSTSYLFSYGPFFHTGLKADFSLPQGFGAMVGVFNNTDSRFNDPGYYYGAQVSAEVGGLAAYLNFLTGVDEKDVIDDTDATTTQFDLTATYEFSDAFMLGLNASRKMTAVGDVDGDGFTGAALYVTAGVSEAASINLRAETFQVDPFEDVDGRNVFALTASGNITIGDLRLIPEVRFDSSKDFATTYSGGIIDFGGSDEDESLASVLLAAVYSF